MVQLMDAVTTNKTEFFREPAHFDFLARGGLAALTATRSKLKAWSAACSTGAEPYTLALVLAEHARASGRPLDYAILCTDLCTQVLAEAFAGIYFRRG